MHQTLKGCLTPPEPQRLSSTSGVYAELRPNAAGDDTLQVRSPQNELLFEVDPATGTTRVGIPNGDLELTAERGDLNLRAAGNIRLEGNDIEAKARHRLTLMICDRLKAASTLLKMVPHSLGLSSGKVHVSAEQLESKADATKIAGRRISMTSKSHSVQTERLDTVAETVTENTGNVYRIVRDLVQTQAGRVRTFVRGLSHFRSKRAYFSSEETFNIDGEKINLG